MLNTIKDFFDRHLIVTPDPVDHKEKVQMATAALLIEISRQDYKSSDDPEGETQKIMEILQDLFGLENQRLEEVLILARAEMDEATDFHQFTQLVNDNYKPEDKFKLMENLWRVAYVDGRIERYEEHFLRRVSGLLHLTPSEFIACKLAAKSDLSR